MAVKGKTTREIMLQHVRILFSSLQKPSDNKGFEEKYTCRLLIEKDDYENLNAYQRALEAAYAVGRDKLTDPEGFLPPLEDEEHLLLPLKDGDLDKPEYGYYQGCFYINASTRYKPAVIRRNQMPLREEIPDGSTVNARLFLYAYGFVDNQTGKYVRGIGCAPDTVQLVDKGHLEKDLSDFENLPCDDEDDAADNDNVPF